MPEFSKGMTVFAPAKVNLHLAVKDRRQDGFHDIESVFLAVDFGDSLRFSLQKKIPHKQDYNDNLTNIIIKGIDLSLPIDENIVSKAVSLFREKTGFSENLEIILKKRIPPGGGLGGGSSDAASALLVLNKIAGFPCSRDDLLLMAAALGSDVPFFIYETSAAMVTGRGERIEPVNVPQAYIMLVNPGFPSNTAAAFRLLDEYREQENTAKNPNQDVLRSPLIAPYSKFLNDFLPVFNEPEKSIYRGIISQLEAEGAEFASLSGSGSTCFGIFPNEKTACKAFGQIKNRWKFVKLSKTFIRNNL